jgi:hypothetical protein
MPSRKALVAATFLLLLPACEKSLGKAVPPSEKKACAEVGNRVTVTGYFLASESYACMKDACTGNLVAELPPRTQGLPMERLGARAPLGEGKNKIVKASSFGGSNWRSIEKMTSNDGTSVDGAKKARFSGELEASTVAGGCSLVVDRIDPAGR